MASKKMGANHSHLAAINFSNVCFDSGDFSIFAKVGESMTRFHFQIKPPKNVSRSFQKGSFERSTHGVSWHQRKWALTTPIWQQLIFEMFVS